MHTSCGGMATGKMNRRGKVEGAAEKDRAMLEAKYHAQQARQSNQSRAIEANASAGDHFDELARLRQQQAPPAQLRGGVEDVGMHPDECRDRLEQFYMSTDPNKVGNIDKLMAKYEGQEQTLLATVE